MRVLMLPTVDSISTFESGIARVIQAYHRYAPAYGIEYVDCTPQETQRYDLLAVHAGSYAGKIPGAPLVAHCHGLYWTAEYKSSGWEYAANADVIRILRNASRITVPSPWVAETFKRDMRISPTVIGHGIDWADWQGKATNQGYVLWNKNRAADVCSPESLKHLAETFPATQFVSTFLPDGAPGNISKTGVIPHNQMKRLVQSAAVYLSTTEETFGIGVLEAMASGVPVLGFRHGGNIDLVQHGVNGYLAERGNYDELAEGLVYCLEHRKVLGENGRQLAQAWTWQAAMEKVAAVYEQALSPTPQTAAIVIPSYNYGSVVGRAVESAMAQTYGQLKDIIVVDDGSDDGGETERAVSLLSQQDSRVRYIRQENSGVAVARNRGIQATDAAYISCLDADDTIKPEFISVCVQILQQDPSLGIAYTGLEYIGRDGRATLSEWPGNFDPDDEARGKNQIPTCCVFRRSAWERTGGYKSRYCPDGAGEEDAEFFLRVTSIGYGAKKATDAGMFTYALHTGRVSGNINHKPTNFVLWHPWARDHKFPFAAPFTPENGQSHPVRSYYLPEVSVIIPVGPGHESTLYTALDSLEAQSFRGWEVIVVLDGTQVDDTLKIAYPYVRWMPFEFSRGAGAARNSGAAQAQGQLLLFLDADDWLYPDALERMVSFYWAYGNIVYSDYVGKALMDEESARALGKRLLYYDHKTNEAVISYQALDYDCPRAQRQPEIGKEPYIWSLICSLVPKAWHEEIGGFDETMESWEDWDYWLRMAQAGKCFTRMPEPLMVYRFYTGGRREAGLQNNKILLQYLLNKYQKGAAMPCGCGKTKTNNTTAVQAAPTTSKVATMAITDQDLVEAIYNPGTRGNQRVYGAITKRFYGYLSDGAKILVDKRDMAVQPDVFKASTRQAAASRLAPPSAPSEPLPPPVSIIDTDETRIDMIPGITASIASQLNADGIHTLQQVYALGVDGLIRYKSIAEKRAQAIMAFLEKRLNQTA